jgi:hypothetical protein
MRAAVAVHARQHKPVAEPLMGRARVPARREGVPEANGVFSVLG